MIFFNGVLIFLFIFSVCILIVSRSIYYKIILAEAIANVKTDFIGIKEENDMSGILYVIGLVGVVFGLDRFEHWLAS